MKLKGTGKRLIERSGAFAPDFLFADYWRILPNIADFKTLSMSKL